MSENEVKEEAALEKLPELESACRKCGGKGEWEEYGRLIICPNCDGAGHIPTDFGKKVIALIQHNLRLPREASWR